MNPLHRAFESWAHRQPNSPALIDGSRCLSYAELNERANGLAHFLLDNYPTSIVAMQCSHGTPGLLGMLGILKAGKAYLPLDPNFPSARVEQILHLVGLEQCLSDAEVTAAASPRAAPPPVEDGRLMYLMHTSGSTGQPRGVRVLHRNLSHLFPSCRDWVPLGADQCWSWLHPLSFGFSVWEIWGALAHGGCLAVVPRGQTFDARRCWEVWQSQRVTVTSLTPSAFRVLCDDLSQAPQLPHLDTLVFSGEPVVGGPLRRWFQHFGSQRPRLLNMYALTETSGEVACHQLDPEDCDRVRSRMGRPLPGVEFRLVDDQLEEVGEGEILIAGPMVADGYLGGEASFPRRFLEWQGKPAYLTGDLARRLEDGSYEYLGRKDRQCKVGGHRLDPGEIEEHLRALVPVRDVVVRQQGESLVAYLVSDAPVPSRSLRQDLLQRLPPLFVPDRYQRVESLPLTHHGKLDEGWLGRLDERSPMQEVLQAAWSDLLDLEAIAPGDDFFDLGGHSLLAMRLISMLRNHLGLEVTMRDLIDHPTLEGLAGRLEQQSQPATAADPEANFLRHALQAAGEAVERGSVPYAACVVHQGKVIALECNRVLVDNDPTAHAEMLAISQASRHLSVEQLSQCELYSTVEPCSMCLSAAHWAGIRRIAFGARQSDEQRFGLAQPTIPSAEMARLLASPLDLQPDLCREEVLALFERWLTRAVPAS